MRRLAPRLALARVSLVAATGGFLFGYDTAVINGANQFLTAHFSLSPAQEGLAAASAIIGCIPGALAGGALSDRVGRKRRAVSLRYAVPHFRHDLGSSRYVSCIPGRPISRRPRDRGLFHGVSGLYQ